MVLVTYNKFNDGVGTVQTIVCNPSPEMIPQDNYFQVDKIDIPVREDIPNMDAYLRVNLETKELNYDYILRETFETKVSALQQENNELKQAIADLTATLAAVLAG